MESPNLKQADVSDVSNPDNIVITPKITSQNTISSLSDKLYHVVSDSSEFELSNENWVNEWSLEFRPSELEMGFNRYLAAKYLLTNQTSFLLLSIGFVLLMFILPVAKAYQTIVLSVHCFFIVTVSVGLILSLTKRFQIYIHQITSLMLGTLFIDLEATVLLSDNSNIPSNSLLTVSIILFGMCAFVSLRFKHTCALLCIFYIFLVCGVIYRTKLIKWTTIAWFNCLLIFILTCVCYIIRTMEIYSRKIFQKILKRIKKVRTGLHRSLTHDERQNVQNEIEKEEKIENGTNQLFPRLLEGLADMGNTLSHLQPLNGEQSEIIHPRFTKSPTIQSPSQIASEKDELECKHEFETIAMVEHQSMDIIAEHRSTKSIEAILSEITPDINNQSLSDSEQSQSCADLTVIRKNTDDLEMETTAIHHNRGISIVHQNELPSYHGTYAHISHGYRIDYDYKEAILSVFQWHNESINIWTEIIPFLLNFFCVIAYIRTDRNEWKYLFTAEQWFIFICAVVTLLIRPVASAMAHTFYGISEKAYHFWWQIDYSSIILTIASNGFVTGSFTFYCLPQLRIFFFCALASMFLSTMFSTIFAQSNVIRAASFAVFSVFSCGVPFIYAWINLHSHSELYFRFLLLWTAANATAVAALAVKSVQCPESCAKNTKFDTCVSHIGASHQIWHILINSSLCLTVYSWTVFVDWKAAQENMC